jgi:hypothetical protein
LGGWTSIFGQLDLLRNDRHAHPNFDATLPRQGVLVDRSLSVLTVQAASFCSCPVASSHVVRTSRGVR